MAEILPTPRLFITALINSLGASQQSSPQNPTPLKNLSLEGRSILTTLHVLFPTPILLPALDLLDRQLVTRFIESNVASASNDLTGGSDRITHADITIESADRATESAGRTSEPYLYVVTSASDVRSKRLSGARHAAAGPPGGQTYNVRTRSWHCTCAAFTFAAFPAHGTAFSLSKSMVEALELRKRPPERLNLEERTWEFGGSSRDGEEGDSVPCCKHLLACVLAERCNGMLAHFVVERHISRDEMAGIAAGA